ncbi:MAG: hypothetical protein GF346_10690 [Candidatus Eisenbacteria bacterium]|nr:hypothetical protein [Candidatus Latescibacterota bacterium]MBD3302904.1 hypothetical protein [Candidatus Eisenbacteria bacterium]
MASRITHKRVRKFAMLLMIPALAILVGCPFSPESGDDDPPPPPDEYDAPVTIDVALENLQRAYKERNYDEYEKLIHSEFSFVFDPRDVGPDTWPEATWGRGEELDVTRNMFSGEPNREDLIIERIRLDWTAGEPHESPDNEEWQRVILTPVDLELQTVNQNNGDQVFLVTPGGYETYLHFVQTDEEDPETELPLWRIIMWEDKPPVKKGLLASR